MSYICVALDVPIDTLFDYRAPLATKRDIGRRVLVPLGKRRIVGVILALNETPSVSASRIKSAIQIFDEIPALSDDVLALMRFCASYYHHPLGEVVLSALPKRLRRTTQISQHMAYRYVLAPDANLAGVPARAIAKRRLLDLILNRGTLTSTDAATLSAAMKKALKELVSAGLVEQATIDDVAAQPVKLVVSNKPLLTDDQLCVLHAIKTHLGQFNVSLLHGITGSGKTEIYLHLIEETLAKGGQTLILVPEINLTPQLEAIFRQRFPDSELISLHSKLSEGERLDNWLKAQSGAARIVLGTRLAIFTPLPDLQLIVVDEEHDPSFKQQDGLRYSARDVAILRAKHCGIPIVLGSATPSLESYAHASAGDYQLLALNNRINAPLPLIDYIDIQNEKLHHGLSQQLVSEIDTYLSRNEQILIFINRRGYAPALLCSACGWVAPCHRCSGKLVLHLREERLRCHHCGHEEKTPTNCPDCGNQALTMLGQGTQRIEEALAEQFPKYKILRVDRDTTKNKFAWQDMRKEIQENKVNILVGTQILAKGHDFPNLGLVAVLNADNALYSADFRGEERLFSQLVQVAGRAGRGTVRGRVVIQTQFPHHPLYRALQSHDYRSFAQTALEERKQAKFPPFVHQALLRAESKEMASVMDYLKNAAKQGAALNSAVAIFDPVEAPMRRMAGRERAQILVQSESRKALQGFLTRWYTKLAQLKTHRVRWALDVDPIEF